MKIKNKIIENDPLENRLRDCGSEIRSEVEARLGPRLQASKAVLVDEILKGARVHREPFRSRLSPVWELRPYLWGAVATAAVFLLALESQLLMHGPGRPLVTVESDSDADEISFDESLSGAEVDVEDLSFAMDSFDFDSDDIDEMEDDYDTV